MLGGRTAAVLSWVGDLSFAMYLVHPIIYQMYGRLLAISGLGSGTSQVWGTCLLAVALVLTILASLAFFRFIERPFLRSRLQPGWTPALEVSTR
jgi:peptidoglycan/LPS O-acetylase OafA/YrhL